MATVEGLQQALQQQTVAQQQQIEQLMKGFAELQTNYQAQVATNTDVTAQLHQAQGQVQLLSTQIASRADSAVHTGVIESKLVEKVRPFNGERASWRTWEFMWRSYLVSQNNAYSGFFQKVDTDVDERLNATMAEANDAKLSAQIYYMLIMAMPENSAGELIMRNCPVGEGAVAWKRLLKEYNPAEVGNMVSEFRKLVTTSFATGADIAVEVGKLDDAMNRYQKMSGEDISATIAKGILLGALENEKDVQQHLFHNLHRFATCNDLRSELVAILATRRSVNVPMEIDALKGKGKGKKGKTGKGKGKDPDGCFYCGKAGHRKAECRQYLADQKKKEEAAKAEDKKNAKKDQKRAKAKAKAAALAAATELAAMAPTAASLASSSPGSVATASTLPVPLRGLQATVKDDPAVILPHFIFMLADTTPAPAAGSTARPDEEGDVKSLGALRRGFLVDSGAQMSAVPYKDVVRAGYEPPHRQLQVFKR